MKSFKSVKARVKEIIRTKTGRRPNNDVWVRAYIDSEGNHRILGTSGIALSESALGWLEKQAARSAVIAYLCDADDVFTLASEIVVTVKEMKL